VNGMPTQRCGADAARRALESARTPKHALLLCSIVSREIEGAVSFLL
jgi:hypothetical protein